MFGNDSALGVLLIPAGLLFIAGFVAAMFLMVHWASHVHEGPGFPGPFCCTAQL